MWKGVGPGREAAPLDAGSAPSLPPRGGPFPPEEPPPPSGRPSGGKGRGGEGTPYPNRPVMYCSVRGSWGRVKIWVVGPYSIRRPIRSSPARKKAV